jgi:hypothetical protein
MLSSLLRPNIPADLRDELVIAPHHPDRLRGPAARLGASTDDRFLQALAWNVFRTLELLAPAFWLRRFHLRMPGDPAVVPAQVLRVSLWRPWHSPDSTNRRRAARRRHPSAFNIGKNSPDQRFTSTSTQIGFQGLESSLKSRNDSDPLQCKFGADRRGTKNAEFRRILWVRLCVVRSRAFQNEITLAN